MNQIDEIKQKIDIVDLVGGYVSIKKSGRNYKGNCPFHSENTPSLMVSQELQIYKCFGCGAAGDIFSFLQNIEGIDFPSALTQLAEKAGVVLLDRHVDKDKSRKKKIFEINKLSAEFYNYLLTKHPAGKVGLDYLKNKRQLKDETIKSFKLGYAPDTWDTLFQFLTKKGYSVSDIADSAVVVPKKSGTGYIDKFRDRITFPLAEIDGSIVGFTARTISGKEPKYLNTNETLVFHKNSFVYALDKAKVSIKKDGVVFVEGQMDVISAHEAGFINVVASSGTSLTPVQLKVISRYTKDLTFCFDSDTAGVNAIHRSIELAEKDGFNIKVAMIPPEYKDLDEVIKSNPDTAKNMFTNAIPAYDFYLVSALKRYDKHSSIGKKKIMDELLPVLSSISNKVTLDHYVKKVSESLDLSSDTIFSVLKSGTFSGISTGFIDKSSSVQRVVSSGISTKNSPAEYLLSLLLHAGFDILQTFVYKLELRDFVENNHQRIFVALKDFLQKNNSFDAQAFVDILDGDLKDLVNDLYLKDIGDFSQEAKNFSNELNVAYARVHKDTIKRELKNITEKIKLAELEKNTALLESLLKEHKNLSENLL